MEFAILDCYDIDYKKGLERCLDDEEFYEEMLKGFLDDDSFSKAKLAYNNDDNNDLFQAVHDLKSVCGNVGIDDLYRPVCAIVELLRNGTGVEKEILKPDYNRMEAEYLRAREGIEKAIKKAV